MEGMTGTTALAGERQAERPSSQVVAANVGTKEALDRLDHELSSLFDELTPVLRADEERGAEVKGDVPSASCSSLAFDLRTHRDRALALAEAVAHVRARLDL